MVQKYGINLEEKELQLRSIFKKVVYSKLLQGLTTFEVPISLLEIFCYYHQ